MGASAGMAYDEAGASQLDEGTLSLPVGELQVGGEQQAGELSGGHRPVLVGEGLVDARGEYRRW